MTLRVPKLIFTRSESRALQHRIRLRRPVYKCRRTAEFA